MPAATVSVELCWYAKQLKHIFDAPGPEEKNCVQGCTKLLVRLIQLTWDRVKHKDEPDQEHLRMLIIFITDTKFIAGTNSYAMCHSQLKGQQKPKDGLLHCRSATSLTSGWTFHESRWLLEAATIPPKLPK